MTLRQLIDSTPMTPIQWVIIAVAAFLNMLDGYDLVAMAYVATPVAEEFALGASALGWLLSAALIGIAFGSIALAPLADRFGRRPLIMVALGVDTLGLIMTAFANSFAELMLWRIVTGIGVGAILTCVTVLVSEFSNLKIRGLAVALYSSGFGIGAALCGIFANRFSPDYGWQIVFIIGAGLSFLAAALFLLFVPETADFYAARGRHEDVIKLAARLGKSEPVPGVVNASSHSAPLRALLQPGWLQLSLRLWLAFSLINFAYTFASQWTPRLLTESGFSAQQGVLGGIMLSFGGTIGTLIYGAVSTRVDGHRMLMTVSFGSAIALLAFVSSSSAPALMFSIGVAVGMLLNAAITGLYTITPQSYPGHLRTTGVGMAIGISRIGSVTAPIVIGYLVDAGWSNFALYALGAVVAAIAGTALIGLRTMSAKIVKKETVSV